MCYNLCNKLWFGCCWAENGHGFRFHKVEPMLGERAAYRQPTIQFGTVKNSPSLHDWTKKKNCPCVICMKLLVMNGLNCVERNC